MGRCLKEMPNRGGCAAVSLAAPCASYGQAAMQTTPGAATFAGDSARLSLMDARRLAFLRNWDLLAAKSDVDFAIAQRVVAREFPNPSLSLGTSKISIDGHPGS